MVSNYTLMARSTHLFKSWSTLFLLEALSSHWPISSDWSSLYCFLCILFGFWFAISLICKLTKFASFLKVQLTDKMANAPCLVLSSLGHCATPQCHCFDLFARDSKHVVGVCGGRYVLQIKNYLYFLHWTLSQSCWKPSSQADDKFSSTVILTFDLA